MPELPEVEEVRRRLRPVFEGACIQAVELRRSNLRFPFQTDLVSRLCGQTVTALRRRAKYLVAGLSSGDVLVMHLGMSGSFRVVGSGADDLATLHDHVVFRMSSGATVVFNDPRRFGSMKIVAAEDVEHDATLRALGPEPLARAFNARVLALALRGRRISLKVALSDQRVVAGLGNIYVCEALHRARLSPKRRAASMATKSGEPRPAALDLVAGIKATLQDAIRRRHRVAASDRFRVYDREGQRCPRRNCGGHIKRIVQAGRSTFFCPVCQK